jgi:hypothetical protein
MLTGEAGDVRELLAADLRRAKPQAEGPPASPRKTRGVRGL